MLALLRSRFRIRGIRASDTLQVVKRTNNAIRGTIRISYRRRDRHEHPAYERLQGIVLRTLGKHPIRRVLGGRAQSKGRVEGISLRRHLRALHRRHGRLRDVQWNRHKRVTRDFYLHPFPLKLGHVRRVTFSFIVHLQNQSIPSQHEYVFIEGSGLQDERPQRRQSRWMGRSSTRIARESWMRRNCSATWTGATRTSNHCS